MRTAPGPAEMQRAGVSLSASSTSIHLDDSVVLSWAASIPKGCTEPLKLNGAVVAPRGTRVVKPKVTTNYVLSLHAEAAAQIRFM
jgi:hypothetical protein